MQQENSVDKRTLLAFGLIFLVLFGWSALFGPDPQPPAGDEPREPSVEQVAGGERPPATIEGDDPELEAPPAAEPTTTGDPFAFTGAASDEDGAPIVVETDLYVAELDAVGGDIRSWRLKRYDTVDGEPVELVRGESMGATRERAHALRLGFEERIADLGRVSFTPSTQRLVLSADEPEGELVLRATQANGNELELVYRFGHDRYGFDASLNYVDRANSGSPEALEISWPGGIRNSEPDTTAEYNEFKGVAHVGSDIHRKSFNDLAKGDKGRVTWEGSVHWAGLLSKYFTALVINPEPGPGRVHLDGDFNRNLQTFEIALPVRGGARNHVGWAVYMGPRDIDRLSRYEADPWNADIDQLVDMGFSLIRPFSVFTLWSLKMLHDVIPNYGWVIIIFSAFTKLLFYPLTKSSTQSMKRMQDAQPELAALREKYKDDQQKAASEMMRIYKEKKINPLGGCLPLLIQMPIFWALFVVLRNTIELRQEGFMLWVTDLSRPDVLFTMPFSLPLFGDKFCVLPFLMAGSMWLQTKISTPAGAMAGNNAMAQQAKLMGTLMPIMMFVFFYNSPSGLTLYWFVNTILTAAQTWRIHSKSAPAASAA